MNSLGPLSVSASVFLDAQAFSQALLAAQPAVAGAWAQEMSATLFRAGFDDEFVGQLHEGNRAIEEARQIAGNENARADQIELANIVKAEGESKRWPGCARVLLAQRASELVAVDDEAAYEQLAALLNERAVIDILTAKLEDVTDGAFKDLTPEEDLVMRLLHGIPLNREGKGPGNFDEVEISDLLGMSSEKVRTIKDRVLEKIDSSVIEALVARIAPQFRVSTEESRAFYEISRKYSRSLKQFLLEQYFMLRGVSEADAEKFIEDHKYYQGMNFSDSVVSLETQVSIPRLKEKLFRNNPLRYLQQFVGDEKTRASLIRAIKIRGDEMDALGLFVSQISTAQLNDSLAVYLSHGCPLEVEVFDSFAWDCMERKNWRPVLQVYRRICSGFDSQGTIEWDLTGEFSLVLTRYFIREKYGAKKLGELEFSLNGFYEFLQTQGIKNFAFDTSAISSLKLGFHDFARDLYGWSRNGAEAFSQMFEFYKMFSRYPDWEYPDSYIFDNIMNDEAKLHVYQRALKKGYCFREALAFCFERHDPLQPAREIEAAMERFSRAANIVNFDALEEEERLALYALAYRSFPYSKFDRDYRFPGYYKFRKYLEITEDIFGRIPCQEFVKRHSSFLRMMLQKRTTLTLETANSLNSMPSHICVYDILFFLSLEGRRLGLEIERLQHIKSVLGKSSDLAIETFYLFVVRDHDRLSLQQIRAAFLLLEAGVEQWFVYSVFLFSDDPEKSVGHFLRSLSKFKGLEEIEIPKEGLSDEDYMALNVLMNLRLRIDRTARHFIISPMFGNVVHVETQLSIKTGKPLLMGGFAKRLTDEFKSMSFKKRVLKGMYLNFPSYSIFEDLLKLPAAAPSILLRVAGTLFSAGYSCKEAFGENIKHVSTSEELEAAVELLESGLAIQGALFKEYALHSFEERQTLRRNMELRVQQFALGEDPKSLDNLDDVMGFLKILNHPSLDVERTKRLWASLMDSPARSNIDGNSFSVETILLPQDLHHTMNKGRLLELAKMVQDRVGRDEITNMIRKNVSVLSEAEKNEIEGLLQSGENEFEEKVVPFLRKLLQSGGTRISKNDMISLLMALAWRKTEMEDVREGILNFTDVQVSSQIIYNALLSLKALFKLVAKVAKEFQEVIGKPFIPRQLINWRIFLHQEFKKVQKLIREGGEKVGLQLVPSRKKMDAFHPFIADNCLSEDDGFTVQALAQPEFLLYRIMLNGEWIGVVQTYTIERRTRQLGMDKEKILVVSGIDPNPNYVLEAESFVKGVLQGFQEIARRHGYDMVVVPAVEGMMSSRRTSLVPEIKRHCRELVHLTKPFGFPRKGAGDYPTSFYKDRKQWEFYVVANLNALDGSH